MKTTVVLVTGSREFTDYLTIYNTIARVRAAIGPFALLHGGARGTDTFAALACRIQRIRVLDAVLPKWKPRGERGPIDYTAGLTRNIQMLDRQPDYVLGFWNGRSTGTAHCLINAIDRRILTMVVCVPR